MLNKYAEEVIKNSNISNFKVEYSGNNRFYGHSIFSIDSVSKYIDIIYLLNECKNKEPKSNVINQICYRGMENSFYRPVPSISFKNLFDFESELVDEFARFRPEEFSSIENAFELIAKMQHYGLPTRLLDFTYNPLVALYFACLESKIDGTSYNDDKQKDGRVLAHMSENNDVIVNQRVANIICSMYRHPYGSLLSNDVSSHQDLFEKNEIEIKKYIETVFYVYGGSVMLRPPYICERQKRQDSVFMLFANDMGGLEGWWELNSEGNKLVDKFEKTDRSKINFRNNLKQITETDIYGSYISFIIKSGNKNKVLNELDYIGINEAFLFPELEYTAKRITDKYSKIILKND